MQSTDHSKFIILTSPRSGSTWLVSLLSQVEEVTAYGELFLNRKRPLDPIVRWDSDFAYPHFVETSRAKTGLRPLGVFAYLDEVYRGKGSVGFKLMYSQLRNFPEILLYLVVHRIKIIHLIRTNPLDLLISQAVKRKLHQSHRTKEQSIEDKVQVELNPNTLIHRLQIKQRKIEKARRLVKLTGLPVLDVSYENLQKGQEAFQSICEFLFAHPQTQMPASKFIKIRSGSQAEVLKNYAEIRTVLAGTQFTAYLD